MGTTRIGIVGFLGWLLVGAPAAGADWVTSHASQARTSYLPGVAVAPPFAVAWEYESPVPLVGAPLVGVGRTFLTDPQFHVWSLDLGSGEVKWKHDEARKPNEVRCYNAMTGDLRWTQEVDGNLVHTPQLGQLHVYVATTNGSLYAFKQHDGGLVWRITPGGPLTLAAADRNLVVIGAGSRLLGVNAADGLEAFSAELGAAATSVPVLTPEGVYVAVGNQVVAVDREGKERWRAALDHPVSTRLAATGAGVLVGSADGVVQLLASGSGARVWETLLAGRPNTVSGAGDVVFAGTQESTLVGLRLADGAKLWSAALGRGPVNGVALTGGRLVVGSGKWIASLVPAPEAPQELEVAQVDGRARLSWGEAAANGSPVSAYRIFRRRGASVQQVGVTGADAREFTQDVLPGNIGYAVSAIAANGAESVKSGEVTLAKGEPLLRRVAVAPHPYDPRAGDLQVRFELRDVARVTWQVLDAEGEEVTRERVDLLPKGAGRLVWDGVDELGRQVEPGVYRVKLLAEAGEESDRTAKAFPVDWTGDPFSQGLAGASGGGPSPAVTGAVAGGGTGPVPPPAPVASAPSAGGDPAGGAPALGGGTGDDGNSNNGVRDHGKGEGRDGAGQGKGQGRKNR